MVNDMRLGDLDALRAEFTGNFGRELWHYTGIWATIDVAPTIDAVPVVRCRDCDFYEYEECACPRMVMSDGAHFYPDPDDFCSYGERKDGDGK